MSNSEHISQEVWERCERYLDQSMDTEERHKFEAELDSDPDLKEQLDNVRNSILGIESAVLRSKLDEYHDDLNPVRPLNPTKKKKFAPWTWSVAAVLVVAIGLFGLLNSGSENEKLFAKHFSPDPGLPTTMSTSLNYEFFDAMVNYKREEYDIAIAKWERLLQDQSKNDTLNYFLGVSYLAKGDTQLADEFLQKIADHPESIFSRDAVHYRALALLKKGETEKAIQLLESNPSERNSDLLRDLR